jgi:lysine-N-methylase
VQLKFKQRGVHERMSKAMSTIGRQFLSQSQYLQIVRFWSARLATDESPARILAELYDVTQSIEERLVGEPEKPSDTVINNALLAASRISVLPLEPRAKTPFYARSLFAYLLGNLCYPSRVLLPFRIERPSRLLSTVRDLYTKAKWLLGRGKVDLLYVSRLVPLGRVVNVSHFLGHAEGKIVREFLVQVIARRHLLSHPRYLRDVLLDLALAAVTISRYARCRAASDGRNVVSRADVADGIAVAELILVAHSSLSEQGRTMRELRRMLLVSRKHYRDLLASEA